ncbi:hypothetical protein [Caminibacter sp.]
MSAIKAFSLIEFILVVLLIGLVTFLVIKLPSFNKIYTFNDLRNILYPNGEIYIFKDGYIILKNGKKQDINFRYSNFEVLNLDFEKVVFPKFKEKDVLFHYRIKNGIGDVYIVKEKKVYLFKPLWEMRFDSLSSLKNYFDSLQPVEGRVK